MDTAVFATYPYTANEGWGEAHEPTIRVVLRSTCLATHRGFESIAEACTHTRTMIHHIAQHVYHLVRGSLANDLMGLRREGSQYIAIVILNASDIEWLYANTLVRESGIGIHHLLHAYLTWSETKTDHRVKLSFYTEGAHHAHQLFGGEERHEVGGNPVAGFLQSPVECHHLALVLHMFIAWRPCYTIAINKGDRVINGAVAWPHTLIHGQGKEVWLNGRTYLTATCCHHVVLEVREVRSTHVCFHGTRVHIHGHESATQEVLVPTDRVHRCHGGIYQSVVGEHMHINRRIEDFLYLGLAHALFLECAVAVGLTHRAVHDTINLLGAEIF